MVSTNPSHLLGLLYRLYRYLFHMRWACEGPLCCRGGQQGWAMSILQGPEPFHPPCRVFLNGEATKSHCEPTLGWIEVFTSEVFFFWEDDNFKKERNWKWIISSRTSPVKEGFGRCCKRQSQWLRVNFDMGRHTKGFSKMFTSSNGIPPRKPHGKQCCRLKLKHLEVWIHIFTPDFWVGWNPTSTTTEV